VHFAALTFRVKRVAVGRIEQNIKTVAAGERDPIRVTNSFLARHAARPDPVLVVLKSARDAEVRFGIVQCDPVKFSRWNFIQMIPAFASGETLINAAIGAQQQTLTNRRLGRFVFVFRFWRFGCRSRSWLNNKRVAIGMNFFRQIFPEVFPGVIGYQQRETEQINALIVRRIDPDLTEIKWARVHRTRARPLFAAILGSKNAAAFAAQIGNLAGTAFITLDYRHNDFGVGRANRETNAAGLRGQTAAEFFPTRAAIRAFENAAHVFATGHARAGQKTPWRPLSRIQRRVKNLRIGWIDNHVAAAGAGIMR